jgi:hypothetical protein
LSGRPGSFAGSRPPFAGRAGDAPPEEVLEEARQAALKFEWDRVLAGDFDLF